MTRLRIIYIASLIILGVLLVFTMPLMTSGEKFSEVQRVQLLEAEDRWIVQFDIINKEGKDTNYTINVSIDGKLYTDKVLITDGGAFSYIYDIYADELTEGEVTFAVYKEGESEPIERITYYLKWG